MEIRNLYFVGRNYVKHVEELGNDIPKTPLIFTKPLSTISIDGNIHYPPHTKELHYEGEMVFIPKQNYYMVGCGIDYTARDVQRNAMKKGKPWFFAKCFRDSTVISNSFFKLKNDDLNHLKIETFVNGILKQRGVYKEKLFKIDEIVKYLNKFFEIGDKSGIFTGTPSGVGEVNIGDMVEVVLYFKDEKIKVKSKILK